MWHLVKKMKEKMKWAIQLSDPKTFWGIPWWPRGLDSVHPLLGVQVQSLTLELSSLKLCDTVKKKKKSKEKEIHWTEEAVNAKSKRWDHAGILSNSKKHSASNTEWANESIKWRSRKCNSPDHIGLYMIYMICEAFVKMRKLSSPPDLLGGVLFCF